MFSGLVVYLPWFIFVSNMNYMASFVLEIQEAWPGSSADADKSARRDVRYIIGSVGLRFTSKKT